MKIVIDIPEEMFQTVKNGNWCGNHVIGEAIRNGTPFPKCNECKYYEGVHKVQGHAPCIYHNIGGVIWDWYCSQFEADKESESR